MKDIKNGFNLRPGTKDLFLLSEAAEIRQCVKNILLTGRGERFSDFSFGGDVRKHLFSLWDKTTASYATLLIEQAIKRYEPRITSVKVDVLQSANNEAVINITYQTRAIGVKSDSVTIELNNIR